MTQSSTATLGTLSRELQLGDFVEAFEDAQAQNGAADLASFLPPPGHSLYRSVLLELVRVDLDHSWKRGRPKPLHDYQRCFPELFADRHSVAQIAYEEFRLRRRAGEDPSSDDYQRRFGVATAQWPSSGAPSRKSDIGEVRASPSAAKTFEECLAPQLPADDAAFDSWCESWGGTAQQAHLIRDLHRSSPAAAYRLTQALTSLPEAGTEFLGFRLLEELGQGGFGKVFLAQQGELANRLVALKIATDLLGESQTLAQLQHTHIVPIYSVHHAAPFQAVCMPYFGRTTLADVLSDVARHEGVPLWGVGLVSTLRNRITKSAITGQASGLRGQRSGLRNLEPARRDDQTAQPLPPASDVAAPTDSQLDSQASSDQAQATLAMLEQMTYVQSVLWLAVRLADGLAHAHDRGILHRDLKPANVLLTDEGQPMLLDFNLSTDTKIRDSAAAASVGGTLPYMSPEHLEAFRNGKQPLDARSDLYSFGVILYELLTGRAPFPQHRDLNMNEVLDRMIADRRQPPRLRPWNKAVTPAVESVVLHCLQADPARRYQTAHDLRDDLQRHLEDKPLRCAPEPSFRERTQKWMRRHPRLTSWTTLAAIAATLVLTLTPVLAYQAHRSSRLSEAQDTFLWSQEEMRSARFLLNTHSADPGKQATGKASCLRVLERYPGLDSPAWSSLPVVSYLPSDKQQQLREDLGEALWLLARSTLSEAADLEDGAGREEQLNNALRMNHLAQACYAPGQAPSTLWRQRAELARRLGREDEAQRWKTQARQTPLHTARDHYLLATELAVQGELRQALPLLQEATRLDPRHFWAWFILGVCQDQLGQHAEARSCYTACIALWPEYPWSFYNRGLVHLREQNQDRARADFDEALRLQPNHAEILVNRSLAHPGKPDLAIEDLTRALEHGASPCRVYFMRARFRDQAGDPDGARQDRAEGLRQEPADEHDWIARGLARLPGDLKGALADFTRAAQLNPRSLAALQNQAHVLAEWPECQGEAIQALNRLLTLYPDYVPARSGRGVLLARQGQAEAALQDAAEALRRDTSPRNLYQVAGIYALTSRPEPDNRREALRLLSAALRKGFGFELLGDDRDLDPIRGEPEFKRLEETARTLQEGADGQDSNLRAPR